MDFLPKYQSSPKMSHDDLMLNEIMKCSDKSMSPSELENDTITKQRRELQLLIGELKDRDRELNDMVSAHQQQLSAWERDRRRVVELENRNEKLEIEIRKRNEQLRLLIQHLKVSDSKQRTKGELLESAQRKLKKVQSEVSEVSSSKQDLKMRNEALNSSLNDLNVRIEKLETKEQDFVTQLQLKDGDLVGAESHISELASKLHRLEAELHECRKDGASAQIELEQQRTKHRQCRAELDHTITEMATKTSELIAARQELSSARDDLQQLRRDLYLSEEELKRKEELLDLQKSKQERSDLELAALRQLYERQQQELTTLQVNLENAQDLLSKQEERLNNISRNGIDIDALECSSQTTNDLLEEARRSTEMDSLVFRYSPKLGSQYPSQSFDAPCSPTGKLQRLLTESREMVHSLEKQASGAHSSKHLSMLNRRTY